MTDANDNSAGGLHGIRAADSRDPTAPTQEKTEDTKEIFACPHCRRAFTLGQLSVEIANQKAARKEEASRQEVGGTGEGVSGS